MKNQAKTSKATARTKIIISVGVFVLVAIVVSSIIFVRSATRNAEVSAPATYKVVDACDVLTLEEAKSLLGTNAVNSQYAVPNPEKDAIGVTSFCSYTNGQSDLSTLRVVSVSVNSPLSEDGQAANTTIFESNGSKAPLAGDQAISGYGDKAFWDSKIHKLSVLEDDKRIEITYGGSDQTTHTLDDAKKVADIVFKK